MAMRAEATALSNPPAQPLPARPAFTEVRYESFCKQAAFRQPNRDQTKA
jgi:hypothetical protein